MGDWNLPWREYNNGTLFFIQMFMWFAVMFFICRRSKEVRWEWNDAPLKLGIALAVYFFGAFLSRGSTWVLFLAQGAGLSESALEALSIDRFQTIGTFISVMGGMCAIRLLMRDGTPAFVWIGAGLFSLVAPLAIHRWFDYLY